MPKIDLKKRLNIFIDETGEFGFAAKSAKLYGVSMVCHDQSENIDAELLILSERLTRLEFSSMIHMGELVAGHGAFDGMNIGERKKIYVQLYKFAASINAKYSSIILEKHDLKNNYALRRAILAEMQNFILNNLTYIQQFDTIRIYYDGGQKQLSKIVNEAFGIFSGYEMVTDFSHTDKKLFQVADMLTYVDKIIYKNDHKIKFSNTEKSFFDGRTINRIKRELRKNRF